MFRSPLRICALGVAVATLLATASAVAANVGDRYDAYVGALKNRSFSFGGDFDVKEALVDWGKALVGNLPIPQEKQGSSPSTSASRPSTLMNSGTTSTLRSRKAGAVRPERRPVHGQAALHNVARSDPEDFEKVAHKLGLNEQQAEALIEPSVGFAQGFGEASSAAADKQAADALKKIELTALDELCTACEIGRKSVLLGIAESKETLHDLPGSDRRP